MLPVGYISIWTFPAELSEITQHVKGINQSMIHQHDLHCVLMTGNLCSLCTHSRAIHTLRQAAYIAQGLASETCVRS